MNIKERKMNLKKGFYSSIVGSQFLSYPDQEEVEKNPRKYIIEELINPCTILWGKNIFPYMTSLSFDDSLWIAFQIDDLSVENMDYITSLDKKFKHFAQNEECIYIEVNNKGEEARNQLAEIACGFKMQDIPKEATISVIAALIQCGYSKKIPNPSYIPFEEYQKLFGSLSNSYYNSSYAQKDLVVFDDQKWKRRWHKKSVFKILASHGFSFDQSHVYKSAFYHKKHVNYLRYLKTKEMMQTLEKKM